MKELKDHKLCASDRTPWILKDPEAIEENFQKWLKDNDYA